MFESKPDTDPFYYERRAVGVPDRDKVEAYKAELRKRLGW